MYADKLGKTQSLAIAPFMVKEDAASPGTEPIGVKLPKARKSLVGTVRMGTAPSVCFPIVYPHGYQGL